MICIYDLVMTKYFFKSLKEIGEMLLNSWRELDIQTKDFCSLSSSFLDALLCMI